MSVLQQQLAAGGNVSEISEKAGEVMKREGGIAGLTGQLKGIAESLPPEQKKDKRFADIQQQVEALIQQVLGKGSLGKGEGEILSLLRDRLDSEIKQGKVKDDRAETLRGMLGQLGKVFLVTIPTFKRCSQNFRKCGNSRKADLKRFTISATASIVPRMARGQRLSLSCAGSFAGS